MTWLSPLFEQISLQVAEDLFPQGLCHKAQTLSKTSWSLNSSQIQDLFKNEHQRLGIKSPSNLNQITSQTNFVMTGQQAVLLGGPLLIWEKAQTTIHLAQKLNSTSTPCLPIFWIAGDDSDGDEATHLEDLQSSRIAPKFSYTKESMVSSWILDADFIAKLTEWCRQCQLNIDPKEFYEPGQSWVSAFAKILQTWFGTDLLIIDGGSPLLRQYSRTFLSQWIQDHNAINQHLWHQETLLKRAKIPIQVPHLGQIRLFATDGTQRWRYESPRDQELEISHDALSRAVMASALFPIQSQILGPGELRYFAQLTPLFQHFHIPIPTIQSRMHGSLLRIQDFNFFHKWNTPISLFNLRRTLRDWIDLHWDHLNLNSELKWTWLKPDGDPSSALGQTQARLHNKWNRDLIKEQKRLALQYAKNDSCFWNEVQDTWKWLGSGRPQERQLSYWELDKWNLTPLLHKFDPLNTQHQIGFANENSKL